MQGFASFEFMGQTSGGGGEGGAGNPAMANLQPARDRASAFERAANERIAQTLSRDSQKFLKQVEQQGAQ